MCATLTQRHGHRELCVKPPDREAQLYVDAGGAFEAHPADREREIPFTQNVTFIHPTN